MIEFTFSKLRQELEKASLEIIRSRQYRGARESDYRAWLCDYVESNFVAKSDYDALKAKLEKSELEVKFVKEYLNPADTSFKQMIDAFRSLPKEKQDKLINLSQSLADFENT